MRNLQEITKKAFTMGYRFGTISNNNREVFGNLIDEILHYCSTQEVVDAFRLGEQHGIQDLKLIIGGVKKGLKEIDRAQREVESLIDQEEKLKQKPNLQQMIDNMPSTGNDRKGVEIDMDI